VTLLLRHSRDLPQDLEFDFWFPVTDTTVNLPPGSKWPDVATRLEQAYDRCADACWETGLALAKEPGSEIARTPTMGAYGTDFRLMMAWVVLSAELADAAERYLVVCNDPWVFREIAMRPDVVAGSPPGLIAAKARLRLRGLLSRSRNAFRLLATSLRLRGQRKNVLPGGPAILVYGHPGSKPDGADAYFGDLLDRETSLQRVLHSDCSLGLARILSGPRTASIHAWGSPFFALSLVWTKWRRKSGKKESFAWLVDRAVEIENSGAGPLMTRWQMHCQDNWIKGVRPSVVAWPWENFAWERALCRTAKRQGVKTIGYQHTVVGCHQINFAACLNPDGETSLPDTIVCNGPGYRRELEAWGHPAEKMPIGGAFRVSVPPLIAHVADAPVYFALSGLIPIARAQIEAAQDVARTGRLVLFRDHPMYPMDIGETDFLSRADKGLREQSELSAVVYSTGTSGLEAMMSGVPTIRFQPDDRVAVQVLPEGVTAPTANRNTIVDMLRNPALPEAVSWDQIFAPVDYAFWHSQLSEAGNDKAYCLV
tara:strand:- start:3556 stop:5172 length:1617 start_codon:yes stop_codon:yes gene_type:complete